MDHKITIEYKPGENSMSFTVDADEFEWVDPEEIEAEIQSLVDADARSNVSFYPLNIEKAVAAIQEALEEIKKEEEEDDEP
jgi:hypothetical protein